MRVRKLRAKKTISRVTLAGRAGMDADRSIVPAGLAAEGRVVVE